jgi:mono/diheme cytochrome c family protein
MRALGYLALGCLAAPLALAACGPARRGTPFGPPLQLTAQETVGQRLFMQHCNQCHPGGAAGLGPALNNKPLPGFAMRLQIRKGVGAMPGFSEELLSNAQVEAIVAYLDKLQRSP